MSVAILDGPAVTKFVEDGDAFNKCVEEHFMVLDVDGDGVLSRSELQKEFDSMLLGSENGTQEEIANFYEIMFDKFDSDKNGTVDVEEYRSEMKEIMLAVAQGIGDSPIQVALECNSFLMRAFQHDMGDKVDEE
ncbi:Calcium-binding ef-hand [Thalictrum thalictroides]|uniref:Calcium-binding ef-hand n=1 Tax=Thalictrum thalictroides TaxID=46969 RepID=A0A7J6WET6_THATH|nr:Calcium-binding ef-hand [Thalictrum thalictroides]